MMIIQELMTDVGSCLSPDERLSTAVGLMQKSQYSCVLIVENSIPVGILTERDIVRLFSQALEKQQTNDVLLKEVMTTDLVCVKEQTTLYDGLYLAWNRNLRHLPVIDDKGKLVGLVTQTDMISCYSRFYEKQNELESANKKLRSLSYEDALLGIGNRRAMEAGLVFTAASSKRTNKTYAIALLDIDYFKRYNDYYGHQEGDAALQRLTLAMKNNLRDSDQLYRYGGEEFLLLMPDTNLDDAIIGSQRIRQAVENLHDPHCKSQYNYLTVSVGVTASSTIGWADMIKHADQALYNAKTAGRNQVCQYQ